MKKLISTIQSHSSKTKPLHIPLPNFKFFHKPSSEEEVDDSFIGREEISEKLTDWVENGNTGSYLVAGYRGMGKSSFVGKVLNEITDTSKKRRYWFNFLFVTVGLCVFYSLFYLVFFMLLEKLSSKEVFSILFLITVFVGILSFFGLLFILNINRILKRFLIAKVPKKHRPHIHQFKTWFSKVYKISYAKKSKFNIVIKINLGHEILNERDILSIISKRIYDEFLYNIKNAYSKYRWITTLLTFVVAAFVGILISYQMTHYFTKLYHQNNAFTTEIELSNNTSIKQTDVFEHQFQHKITKEKNETRFTFITKTINLIHDFITLNDYVKVASYLLFTFFIFGSMTFCVGS